MENEENSVVSTSTSGHHGYGYLAQLDLNQMDDADLGSEVISIKHTNSSYHQMTSIFNKTFCACGLKL